MAIWNLGSINLDHVYRVPHMPQPGETLAATAYAVGLGGKGANQSVAAARAGADVRHIGAVGPDGAAVIDRLAGFGMGVDHIAQTDTATGHAIIHVDPAAENMIVLYPGANQGITAEDVARALADAAPGDFLMLQNETSAQADAAQMARDRGLRVVYSAAPFDVAMVEQVLPHTDMLVMNEVEAAQLQAARGALPDIEMIVTKGAKGAEWRRPGQPLLTMAALPVTPVDTTGAGDCFIGNLIAALDMGASPEMALRRAAAASALQVTRPGASDAMPSAAEVDAFLAG